MKRNPIFVKINTQLVPRKKSSPKFCATSVLFKPLPKVNKPPSGRKFAQSGHPDHTDRFPQNLSISIDRWLVPPKPNKPNTCLESMMKKRPHWMSMAYMRNNMEFMIFNVLYILVNLVPIM
jgi:hypothetical protein